MDLFLQACGAGGPLELSLECQGSARVERLRFDNPFLVIGRAPESDLVLNHREVSERHAYLQVVEGRLFGLDLGSRSGTWLGGEPLDAGWIGSDDSIQVGPYRIRLDAGIGGPDGALVDVPPLSLELTHRGRDASECSIAGGLTLVGGAIECPVRLLDPDVSDVQCSLLSTPDGVWVVDLLGDGGIRVNGVPVRYAMLNEEDELQVGHSSIRIRSRRNSGPRRDEEAPAESLTTDLFTGRSRPGQIDIEAIEALSARERRGSCRYPVADVDALLSWWEPATSAAVVTPAPGDEALSPTEQAAYSRVMARWAGGHDDASRSRLGNVLTAARDQTRSAEEAREPRSFRARLVDISQTGVQVLTTAVPPSDKPVWFRLERPRCSEWVEVALKGATPVDGGTHRVRLAFREACPYDLFKTAVYSKRSS